MKLFPSICLGLAPLAISSCAGFAQSSQDSQPAGIECESSCTVALGQRAEFGALWVRPIEVLEDSRCPSDVQCVWAGRILLRVEFGNNAASDVIDPRPETESSEMEIGSDNPVQIFGNSFTIENVSPGNTSTASPIRPEDYRFTIRIEKAQPAG
ncbi:MAG: hypothetical protein WAT93_08060 [Pontixanthobacter sp.]